MEGPIRHLMLPMLLLMWGSLYWLWSNGLFSPQLVVGIATTHIACTIIFYHFVFVFNFGYALLMIVMPVVYTAAYSPGLPGNVFLTVPILYGVRLAVFTWRRYHSESYTGRASESLNATRKIPLPLVVVIWLFLSSLMFFITFNAWGVASSDNVDATIWPAVIVMLIGLSIETVADRQKQEVKRINKDAFCHIGLYRKIRHPNYLGEIIFHIGFYWGMVSSTEQIFPLVMGGLGTGWVIAMMYSEALVLDRKQHQRYGDSIEFEKYRQTAGLLVPRIF